MSTETCCSRPLSSSPGPGPSSLPTEIIWLILEQALAHPPAYSKDSPTRFPFHILTLNRAIHALIIKSIYRTIIISSSRTLARFLSLLSCSPHIAGLVQSLWIGTPRLEAFAHQVGWVSFAVGRILKLATSIRRLALPYAFFPADFGTTSRESITHVTANGGGIPQLPWHIEVVHVYGLVQPGRIGCVKTTLLRRMVCELRRPCAPGAVARFVHEFLGGDRQMGTGPELALVVVTGLESWLKEELLEVNEEYVFREDLKTRVRGIQEDYCGRWINE